MAARITTVRHTNKAHAHKHIRVANNGDSYHAKQRRVVLETLHAIKHSRIAEHLLFDTFPRCVPRLTFERRQEICVDQASVAFAETHETLYHTHRSGLGALEIEVRYSYGKQSVALVDTATLATNCVRLEDREVDGRCGAGTMQDLHVLDSTWSSWTLQQPHWFF